jgi:monoterpene epsilon-lactone hydrolase
LASKAHEEMVARLAAERAAAAPSPTLTVELIQATRPRDLEVVAPDGTSVEQVDAGGVNAYWVTPEGELGPTTIVYFHGGGYIWHTAVDTLPVAGALATAARARVLNVDYRLAPEHLFPAPVEDAVAAYRWLLEQGVPAGTIVLAGDSAGGGLVIAALVAIRDAGLELPAAGAPISPWTDLTMSGPSVRAIDDPVVAPELLDFMAETYLGDASPEEPAASPLFADLTGLPPLLVQVGTREALLDDARRIVDRARDAGVDVTLVEHEDVIHMWIVFDPTIPESQDAFHRIGRFAAAHVGAARAS